MAYAALPAPLYGAPTVVPALPAPLPIAPSQNLTEMDFLNSNANTYFAAQKTGKVRRGPVVPDHAQVAQEAAQFGYFIHPDPYVHQAMTMRHQKNELLMQYNHRDQITNDLIQHQFIAQRERPLTVGQVTYLDRIAADNWEERNRLIAGDPSLLPGTDPQSQAALSYAQATRSHTQQVAGLSNALVPYSGSPAPAIPSPQSINNYGPLGVPSAPVYQSSFNGFVGTYGQQFGANPYANNFWNQPAWGGVAPTFTGGFPGSQAYNGYIPNSVSGPAYSNYSSYVPAYYGNVAPLAGLQTGTLVRGFHN